MGFVCSIFAEDIGKRRTEVLLFYVKWISNGWVLNIKKSHFEDSLLLQQSFILNDQTRFSTMKGNFSFCISSALFLMSISLCSCKEKNKFYNSDYLVKNETSSNIEIQSSAYSNNSSGSTVVNFNDVVGSLATFKLRNIKAKEDATIKGVFYDIRIFRNGLECTKDEMSNSNWVKARLEDDKFTYTLVVDSTFFQ